MGRPPVAEWTGVSGVEEVRVVVKTRRVPPVPLWYGGGTLSFSSPSARRERTQVFVQVTTYGNFCLPRTGKPTKNKTKNKQNSKSK